jgi:hypothetical protein
MTKRQSTKKGGSKGADGSKRESPDQAARLLTFKDVEPLLARLALAFSEDEGAIGDLLTILAAAAFSELVDADSIYIKMRDAAMCYVLEASEAIDEFTARNILAARRAGRGQRR